MRSFQIPTQLELRIIGIIILTTLSVILLVASLAIPWYYVSFQFESNTDPMCRVRYQIHWRNVWCFEQNCQNFTPSFCSSNFNWRNSVDPKPSETASVFDATAGFLGASLVCAFVMWVVSMSFMFPKARNTLLRLLLALCGILGVFCVIVALLIFAGRLPTALQNDEWLCNIAGVPDATRGPCNSFIGDAEYTYTGDGETFEIWWGALAYWIALIAAFPMAIVVGLAFPKFMPVPAASTYEANVENVNIHT